MQCSVLCSGQVTPLMLSVLRGQLGLVSLLLQAGADLAQSDLVQFTPLHWAAWHCQASARFAHLQ